jgi:glycosyltransferase involved in cell wall biosynthesis
VFRFLYVGPDRPEKGLDLLCKAIARLPAQLHATHPHFILQIQSEVPTSGLLAPGGPTVEIVGAELRRSQYEDLMLSCHAIVLPYQPWHYRARTSSVFVEAVMANRLVIVPADTWMADQLKELEGGGVEFAPYTAGSLAEALSEAIRDYGRLVDCPGREAWCSRNSAESLVAELLLLAENDQGLQLERGPYAA